MRRLFLLCALLACSFAATAKGPGAARKLIESSLHVTGTIDITPAGDVVAHTLDQQEKLPKGIVDIAARLVSQWKFEPVVLQANAIGRSKMSLLFVGKKRDDGSVSLELRSASFGGGAGDEGVRIAEGNRKLAYPMQLMRNGVSGSVFLQLKIGRDGKVMNIDASHVNLRVIGSEQEMKLWRDIFVRSTIATVKDWSFVVPQSGPGAEAGHWFGTLPISFMFEGEKPGEYGRWETYVAGPKALIPWLQDSPLADGNVDALTPNAFHAAGAGRRLLTPLSGG